MRATTNSQVLPFVRKLMPTLAAVVACGALLLGSNRFARAVTSQAAASEPAHYRHTEPNPLILRQERILPGPVPVDLDRRWAALGRALVHEPTLSNAGDTSSATYHKVDAGGDDGGNLFQHLGRFNVTQNARDKNAFKVPGLRNAAETTPHFHEGSASTLQEAVRAIATHQLEVPIDEDEAAAICSCLDSPTVKPREEER